MLLHELIVRAEKMLEKSGKNLKFILLKKKVSWTVCSDYEKDKRKKNI